MRRAGYFYYLRRPFFEQNSCYKTFSRKTFVFIWRDKRRVNFYVFLFILKFELGKFSISTSKYKNIYSFSFIYWRYRESRSHSNKTRAYKQRDNIPIYDELHYFSLKGENWSRWTILFSVNNAKLLICVSLLNRVQYNQHTTIHLLLGIDESGFMFSI